jgi:acetyl-CoA C-acetyltransferase
MTRLLAARRTPVVPRQGAFAALEPHELAAPVIRAVLDEAGLPAGAVGELVLSNALGAGGNPARVAALASGLPERVAGLSLDRQCAGGLDAILTGAALVSSGLHDVVIAGGAESYSRRPLRSRTFADGRPPEPYEQARFTPWADRDPDLAEAADGLARDQGVTRADQEAWAIESHRAALAQPPAGIVPLMGLATDPFARVLDPRLCARARPVTGSITPATMAVAADGAAFVVLVSDRIAQPLARPRLRLMAGATLGAAPERPGLAPVAAIAKVLNDTGQTPEDLAHIELMEAFAVQAMACQSAAALPRDRINPFGGALARGHPVGASGAILAVTLFHALAGTGRRGLAAIAAAGGIGSAALFEG